MHCRMAFKTRGHEFCLPKNAYEYPFILNTKLNNDIFHTKRTSIFYNFFILFLFTELEICSETDSTNECSDFKSELDDELEGDPNQQRLQSTVVPSSVGSGSTGAGSSQSAVSASGQDRVPAGQGVPRKSSGGGRKNTRVVFV